MCALFTPAWSLWLMCGAAICAAADLRQRRCRVAPGTPSNVDLHIEGDVNINGVTAGLMYNHSVNRLVGVDWPGESNPPVAGDWTLDDSRRVVDGDDYSTARSMVDFG